MVRSLTLRAGLLAPLLLARTAGATVWTVSPPGGGGQFTDIQSAVNAASAGDTILVLAGTYPPFVLNKALQVLGAGPSLVTVSMDGCSVPPAPAVVEVTGIPAGGHAVVAGLSIQIMTFAIPFGCAATCFNSAQARGISVLNCAGPVVLSNLQIDPGYYYHGARALSSALVLADHFVVSAPQACSVPSCVGWFQATCARTGAWTINTPLSLNASSLLGNSGSLALRITGASASIAGTILQGGDGAREACAASGPFVGLRGLDGGHGLEAASGASVRLAAPMPGWVRGGNGGTGDGPVSSSCCGGGNGGNCVITSTGSSVLLAPGVPLVPGAAGGPACFSSPLPGVATVGSMITTSATALPSVTVNPPTASLGGTLSFDVRGEPGTLYAVAMATAPAFLAVPGVGGALFLDPGSLTVFASGVLGTAGSANWAATIPPDPNLSTFVGFLQAGVLNPASSALDLSPAAVLAVL